MGAATRVSNDFFEVPAPNFLRPWNLPSASVAVVSRGTPSRFGANHLACALLACKTMSKESDEGDEGNKLRFLSFDSDLEAASGKMMQIYRLGNRSPGS